MGAVDLVIQIESPPSVASALQRVGRAGHQVGETSRGVLFPKHRGDLAQTAVAVQRMRTGGIEALRIPTNPLDVLAQQIVAATALDAHDVDELFELVRRSAPFASSAVGVRRDAGPAQRPLPERRVRRAAAPDGVGPGDQHPHRPPRSRAAGGDQRRHHPRPRAVQGVPGRRRGPRQPGGRLDEEMVYESRVGDVFALRATSWRIEDITHDRVLVSPAPGVPGAAAVLEGRRPGPPGRAGRRDRRVHPRARRDAPRQGRGDAHKNGLDAWAAGNLVGYLHEQRGHQRAAVRQQPRRAVPRRAGRLATGPALPLRRPVHAPWALAINARLHKRYRVDGQAVASDHGIVDPDPRHRHQATRQRHRRLRAGRDDDLVTQEVGGSACSRPGSGSARPGRCCSPAATPAAVPRCGSSASGRRRCSRWR